MKTNYLFMLLLLAMMPIAVSAQEESNKVNDDSGSGLVASTAPISLREVRSTLIRLPNHNLLDDQDASVSTTVAQNTSLSAGINWVSFYVETDLETVQTALEGVMPENGVSISAQNDGRTTYNGGRWRGALASLDLTQMYKITVPQACEFELQGLPVDPSTHPVTIRTGLNWIAFPFMENMLVSDAFSGFAVSGDQVKSMNDGQTTYSGNRWRGAFTTLVPGNGYIYNSAASETRTFVFPIPQGK